MRICMISLLLFSGAASATSSSDHKISTDQAKALAIAALNPQQRKLSKLEAIPDDASSASRFTYLTVVWHGVKNGSIVVENYAIDTYTGDVFSSTGECDEKKNKGLTILQAQIRADVHLSPLQYRKMKTKGPLCSQ